MRFRQWGCGCVVAHYIASSKSQEGQGDPGGCPIGVKLSVSSDYQGTRKGMPWWGNNALPFSLT